jgi:hypothetical protein
MSANGKRKTWDKAVMVRAIHCVRSGEMGYLKASKYFQIPKRSLERYVKDKNRTPKELVGVCLGRKPVLSNQLENQLVNYCIAMEKRFCALRSKDIRSLAFELALRNGLKHPININTRSAGKKWLQAFLKRHRDLSMRTPQGISASRVKAFTPENVAKFFDIYEPIAAMVDHKAHRIFNVDETGITTVQHKHSKVIAAKGKKQVAAIKSSERGNLVTIVTCMNAAGTFVPPLIVFPRKNMKEELMNGAPAGSISACHPSGWIQTHIFTQWFDHFVTFVKPSVDDPAVLILDGYYSHTKNIDIVDKERQNYVHVVCLPPHSTHAMQPLDVGFMGPFKTYYAQEIETWLASNPGRVVTPLMVARLFGKAYTRAATMETSVNAFRKTGLVPCNRHIFRDHDFAIHSDAANEDRPTTSEHPPLGTPDTPGTSSGSAIEVSPEDVRPIPRLTKPFQDPTQQGKPSHSGSAQLLTSTPYRRQLQQAKEKKTVAETKKTAAKRLFGKAQKSSKRKVREDSSSDSDCQSFESENSDNDYEDEDTECLLCTGHFSDDQHGEKWAQCVRCYRWAHEDCGVEEDNFVCPNCVKLKCK